MLFQYDAELLSSRREELTENSLNAITLRMEEKHLLQANIDYLQNMLDSVGTGDGGQAGKSEL